MLLAPPVDPCPSLLVICIGTGQLYLKTNSLFFQHLFCKPVVPNIFGDGAFFSNDVG